MLVRYKKALEKIAMGLISFMPQEKNVKKLVETIQQYEQQDNWVLYLWKKNEEYVGILGLYVEDSIATIKHITVMPNHRGEGVAHEMLQELKDLNLYEVIQSCEETEPFLQTCSDLLNEAEN